MKLKKTTIFGGILLSLVATLVGFSGEALAWSYTSIEQKALGYGVYRCYVGTNDSNNKIMVGTIKPSQFSGWDSVILKSKKNDPIALPPNIEVSGQIRSSVHNIETNNVSSCRELFKGRHSMLDGDFNGLFSLAVSATGKSFSFSSNASKKRQLLELMGYSSSQKNNVGATGKCLQFSVQTFNGYQNLTLQEKNKLPAWMKTLNSSNNPATVCTKNGNVDSSNIDVLGSGNFGISFSKDGENLKMSMFNGNTPGGVFTEQSYKLSSFKTFDDLMKTLNNDVSSHFNADDGCRTVYLADPLDPDYKVKKMLYRISACVDPKNPSKTIDYTDPDYVEDLDPEYSISDTSIRRNGRLKASLVASNNLLGSSFSRLSDLAFNSNEKYSLYKYYVTEYYKADVQCDAQKEGYQKFIYNRNDGSTQDCYAKATKNESKTVYVLSKNNYYDGTRAGFAEVMARYLQAAQESGAADKESLTDLIPATNVENGNSKKVDCLNSGAAGSLGWIVCPVMKWMADSATYVYNNVLEPGLKIEPELFTKGGDSGARQGWKIFQNMANVIFAAMFLVVIFSQLTGWGIDNYGIKKILPKLIIVAILINLSYFICVLCVDLSNILGSSLNELFSKLPANIPGDVSSAVENTAGQVGMTFLSAGLLAAIVAGFTIGAAWNPAIILSLLVGALGALMAFLFLFVLLAGRQAAVLVLTVVSPLAFVCYMLPSLKKTIFDKWLKLGQGLLLVYPICGLLVGGGNYTSRLLASTGMAGGSFFGALTTMLVGIVPIFFIPTVLKGAFAAMGSLGTKLAGFGSKMRGGATGAMRKSGLYKTAQERGAERKTRIKAGYDRDGNKKELGRFGRFIRGGRKNVQRSSLAYQRMVSERGSLEATEGEDFMLQTETANEMKRITAQGEVNDMGKLSRGLQAALENGDRAKIRAYTDALTAKGESGRGMVKKAYDAAVGSGRVSNMAAKTFAANIVSNHAADYKNNNRSMFEVAQAINKREISKENMGAMLGANETVRNYVAGSGANELSGKVTSSTIGNMDDDAFAEVFGGYGSGSVSLPSSVDAQSMGEIIDTALTDQNANIKADRVNYLNELLAQAKANGYKPRVKAVRLEGESPAEISIDHSAPSGGAGRGSSGGSTGSGSGTGRGSAGGSGGSTDSGGPVRIVPGSGS